MRSRTPISSARAQDIVIAGEPMMIKLLQCPVPGIVFEAGGEPADAVGRFVDRHLMARIGEVPGGCQSGRAGADDGDLHLAHGKSRMPVRTTANYFTAANWSLRGRGDVGLFLLQTILWYYFRPDDSNYERAYAE